MFLDAIYVFYFPSISGRTCALWIFGVRVAKWNSWTHKGSWQNCECSWTKSQSWRTFCAESFKSKKKISFKINSKQSAQSVCRTVSCGVQRSLSQTVNRRTERVKGRAASQVRRKALRPRQFLRMCVRHSVPDSPDPDRAWYLNEMYSVFCIPFKIMSQRFFLQSSVMFSEFMWTFKTLVAHAFAHCHDFHAKRSSFGCALAESFRKASSLAAQGETFELENFR